MNLTVAKVGGSLFDMPDLRQRLRDWRESVAGPVLFVPGGGAGADVVRRLDEVHRLGEVAAHWLALRVLTVNAHWLAGIIGAPVVSSPDQRIPLAVIDPHAFCAADETRPGALPHRWEATSDSIAARVAEVAGAQFVLLKSVDFPPGKSWTAAAHEGLVDTMFGRVVDRSGIPVRWVNLRREQLPR